MAVNTQRKNAMKRLATDLHELELQPVENVSAAPLEENMLEWHCNFKHDEIIYHLILYLTDKYPYESPSAEFVPVGFRYDPFERYFLCIATYMGHYFDPCSVKKKVNVINKNVSN